MQIRNTLPLILALAFAASAHAGTAPASPQGQVIVSDSDIADTFGKALKKQAELMTSELDAKLRENQQKAGGTASVSGLPGTNQQTDDKQPTVEAVWGMAGKEVAEITYNGKRIPVSRQEPYISKIDGWKVESINQYQVVLVRMNGNRVAVRKVIQMDWQSTQEPENRGASGISVPGATAPGVIAPPSILSPVLAR